DPGHLVLQRAFDPVLEGDIDHAAAMAAAAEAQHHHAFGGHFLQRHVAAVLGQLRVDLRFDQPAHALDQRGRLRRRLALDLGRADLQLAAGRPRLVVDAGAVEERRAGRIEPERETLAVDRPFVALQFVGGRELQAYVGTWRARLERGQAHADAGRGLAFDELAEVRLGAVGNLDHGLATGLHYSSPAPPRTPRVRPCPFPAPFMRGAARRRTRHVGPRPPRPGPLHPPPRPRTPAGRGPDPGTAAAGPRLGTGRRRPCAGADVPIRRLPPHHGLRERAGLDRAPRG